MSMTNSFEATYGGDGWSPRTRSLQQELGTDLRLDHHPGEAEVTRQVVLHPVAGMQALIAGVGCDHRRHQEHRDHHR